MGQDNVCVFVVSDDGQLVESPAEQLAESEINVVLAAGPAAFAGGYPLDTAQ